MAYHFRDGDQGTWYRMETDGERITFIVHAPLITIWKKWCAGETGREVVAGSAQENGLSPFVADDRVWGFGGCGRYDGEHSEDWDRLTVPLPTLEFEGRDEPNWKAGYNAGFSLELLLAFLGQHTEAGSKREQGMTVALRTVPNALYGGALHADISPAFSRWYQEAMTQQEEDAVTEVMRKAAAKIWRKDAKSTDALFGATHCSCNRNAPLLSCGFGGTLGIDSSTMVEEGRSYSITPHNTDGPLTQLTILTGLAKLDELFHARR